MTALSRRRPRLARDSADDAHANLLAFLGERLSPEDLPEGRRLAAALAICADPSPDPSQDPAEAQAEDFKRRARDSVVRKAASDSASLEQRFPALARIGRG